METNKEDIALRVAAKYHDNLLKAVMEYMVSTGQVKRSGEECRDEMLSFLPGYRHPVDDSLNERMIFINPSIRACFTVIQTPSFVEKVKSLGAGEELIAEIDQYVHEVEKCKLECIEFENEAERLRTLFDKAKKIYCDNTSKRPTERNKLVVQTLGLSTGKAPKRFDAVKEWEIYVIDLVRGQGLSRQDAVREIKKRFDHASYDAAVKFLRDQWQTIVDEWKITCPDSLPLIMNYLKELVPGRIPSGN